MKFYKKDICKNRKFENFVMEQKDFLFIKNNEAIFAAPKKIAGTEIVAFKLLVNGHFKFGCLDKLKNFQAEDDEYYPPELEWVMERLEMAKEYNNLIKNKWFSYRRKKK